MVRKFLYFIAFCVIAVFAALMGLRLFSEELTELTFVPDARFEAQPALAANAYADPARWIARPGAEGPAGELPSGAKPDDGPKGAAVFFIHPTSYLAKARWNAPEGDAESRERADLFVRAMATPFAGRSAIWAPRYRQAAFGAFLSGKPEAAQALDAAYVDVLAAFDRFLAEAPEDAPIVLAGHSQGAFHLKRLLRDRVAGTPLSRRVAAVYAVGWPISIAHDLPAMGLPACANPDQAGCVMSWLSFADPAETAMLDKGYARRAALDGKTPGGSAFLCSNPLAGTAGGESPASANRGTLVPSADLKSGRLEPALAGARCAADHYLHIGPGPELGPFVLPGNNYHVYDVPLFWTNLRLDAARRVDAWRKTR